MAYGDYLPVAAPTLVPDDLVIKHWAKEIWDAGLNESYFKRFMGHDSNSIIHIKEDLHKSAGDTIIIPLRMPLFGAGVVGDNQLEGNEEGLTFRDFKVGIQQIRHAVRLKGEYEEQKTQINLRKEGRNAIVDWLGRYHDFSYFSILTGTPFPLIHAATDVFPFDIEPPSANRTMFAGSATSEGTITAADTFDTTIISKAKRKAIEDEVTAIRPVRIDGADHYVIVIDHWQARDLRADPRWIEAQQHANIRGRKNPIFDGSIGMWDGVVVHENGRVPRTATGAGGVMVGHALLLGAQALTMAEGKGPKIVTKRFDYDNQWGIAIAKMYGLKRSMFQYDGTNWTDYGCLNIMTASVSD